MNITYGWKIGSQIKIDAQSAGLELMKIGEKITPQKVVAFAKKNRNSELNKFFEWDDKVASNLYRLDQARFLLRCITIEKDEVDSKGEKQILIVRAYESVKNIDIESEEKNIYVPIDTALTVPEYKSYVQENVKKAIFELQEKARAYESYQKDPFGFTKGMNIALKAI